MATQREPAAITKAATLTVSAAAALLTTAVGVTWVMGGTLREITTNQARMEERQIAAQDLTNERLGTVQKSIAEISVTLRDGLILGKEARANLERRVDATEHRVADIERRILKLEEPR